MKCIYCQSDTNYKTRKSNGGRCGGCRHPFAFEPRTDSHSIADGLFQRLIKNVSADDTLFFTERQLWYELCRHLWRKQSGQLTGGGCGIIALSGLGGAFVASVVHSGWPLLALVPGVAAGVVVSRRTRRQATRHPPLEENAFGERYLKRWLDAHGAPNHLFPPPAQALPSVRGRKLEPDIAAYSFDRALVTDHAEAAAMLVANNFHVENNCAILSADGYPHEIAGTVLAMLRRNAQLTVFALHDATAHGCALPWALREERWFPDPAVRIIDLGLRPGHADAMKLLIRTGPAIVLSADLGAKLPAEDAAWLEQGQSAELAALRPARLMRAVYQGFARAGRADSGSGNGGSSGDGSDVWIYDSRADVYAADSFG